MKSVFPTNGASVFSGRPKARFLPVNSAASISDTMFYTWRRTFGGMEAPEVNRLKSLVEGNARLRKLLVEAMLDKEALQVALGRKY